MPMAAEGEQEKKGWIDWRIFWIALAVFVLGCLIWGLVAGVLIQPG